MIGRISTALVELDPGRTELFPCTRGRVTFRISGPPAIPRFIAFVLIMVLKTMMTDLKRFDPSVFTADNKKPHGALQLLGLAGQFLSSGRDFFGR